VQRLSRTAEIPDRKSRARDPLIFTDLKRRNDTDVSKDSLMVIGLGLGDIDYRQKAAELRDIAELAVNEALRAEYMRLALQYEELADQVERDAAAHLR
jgi:hypothetical protein